MSTFIPHPADAISIATIRALVADIVGNVNTGHPGSAMGMAPAAHILFTRFLNANPRNSKWFNRDRFVLSNGHACVLQYILLHLLGYKMSMNDLKQFRQLDSNTPGHPEAILTDGVEVTTGPLGQGFANGVGLAIAQAHFSATYNKDGFDVIDNYTYVFTGDGCQMEGVASEAASLAGHLQLGNLIVVYDDNHISIDGDTAVAFTEDVEKRFQAYGWQTLHVDDGDNDLEDIYNAFLEAREENHKPTLIRLRTTIGFGSRDQGTPGIHGAPLQSDDVQALKMNFGLPADRSFFIPQETYDIYAGVASHGEISDAAWNDMLESYRKRYPTEHAELMRRISGKLPYGWERGLPTYKPSDPPQTTRHFSETVLTALVPKLPELIGGSADLTEANLTRTETMVDFQPDSTGLGSYKGTYIRYGVREHAMGAIANGLHAYGGVIPFVGTLLNFVGYAAGAVRLSALSRHQVIWIATHDSIGLGEDGPTHQPIETAAHFRAMPNLDFWRPADGNETSAAYYSALTRRQTPSILALSRQDLKNLVGSSVKRALKGGYVLQEVQGEDLTIVSTGSEVSISLAAAKMLKDDGIRARVVSLPCWSIFDMQPLEYRLSVLRSGAPILSVEALSTLGWQKYSHEAFGLFGFGACGPWPKVYEKFGLTSSNIAKVGKDVVDFYKAKGGKVISPLVKAIRPIARAHL
ncbi:transketolase [Pilatotrama ljubarskyi]|nr:transketolase [Pilatotrama ljubarskyi]